MSDNGAREWLAENPKMMGVVFTLFVLLTQAGSAVAARAGAGP